MMATATVGPSDAPREAAAAAWIGGRVALEDGPQSPVALAMPDGVEGLRERVAEDQARVVASDPRRDAARQHVAVGGDVRERPRPLAAGPVTVALPVSLEARQRRRQ